MLWILLSILVPGGFGFVAYLILMDDHPKQEYVRCPDCGKELCLSQEKSRSSTIGKALITIVIVESLLGTLVMVSVASSLIGTYSSMNRPYHNSYSIENRGNADISKAIEDLSD